MSDDNVVRPDFNTKFPKNEELAGRIYGVIADYDKQISLAELIGVIELVKSHIINAHALTFEEYDEGA